MLLLIVQVSHFNFSDFFVFSFLSLSFEFIGGAWNVDSNSLQCLRRYALASLRSLQISVSCPIATLFLFLVGSDKKLK